MKHKKLTFLLLTTILLSLFYNVLQANASVTLGYGWCMDAGETTTQEFQQMTFYAKNRFWAFYSDGTNIVYRSSTDGASWASEIIVTDCGVSDPQNISTGHHFSLHYDRTYDKLVYATGAVHQAQVYGGDTCGFYRMGTPNADGSITWDAAEQNFTETAAWDKSWMPTITIDDDGYPWIATQYEYWSSVYPGNNGSICVTKSSTKDGTWTTDTAGGFPYILNQTNIEDRGWCPIVLNLGGGNMYVIYTAAYLGWNGGQYYDGSSWSTETISTHNDTISYTKDAVVIDGKIYFIHRFGQPMRFYIRHTNGTWEDTGSPAPDAGGPGLGTTFSHNHLFLVYGFGNKIYYKIYTIATKTWGDMTQLDTSVSAVPWGVQCDREGYYFSVIWSEPSANPTNVKHAYLDPVTISSVTIDNMEGCGNWVFVEKEYYEFTVNMTSIFDLNFDFVKINFTDGVNYVVPYYDITDELWGVEEGEDVANFQTPTVVTAETYVTVTWYIYFEGTILDALDVDIYAWWNLTDGTTLGWELSSDDYFNIYNLGGYSTLETSGTAGRRDGGGVFELYAQNNSWAQANVTFRKLQAYHTYFHIWVENEDLWDEYETDTIEITMGMDYCTEEDDWLEGWYVYLEQTEGWLEADSTVRLQWNVTWYYRGNQIKTDVMNSFPVWNSTWTSPAFTTFVVDLWFNKVNASSTVGGRITAEYFAMEKTSDWWADLWTGSTYSPDVSNITQSMFFGNLVDSSDNIISSKEVQMMRVWTRLEQGANDHDIKVELRDFDLESFTFAPTLMEGVNTPIFIATKTPNMPQGGFLNALYGMLGDSFNQITDALGPQVLGFWSSFVGFLDTVFSFTGTPTLFSDLIGWIEDLSAYVGTGLTTLVTMLSSIFEIVSGPMVTFLSTIGGMITNTISSITGMITQLNLAYNDTVMPLTPMIVPILQIIGIMLPFLELIRMEQNNGMTTLYEDLNTFFDLLAFFIGIFIKVSTLVLYLIESIIERIPFIQ